MTMSKCIDIRTGEKYMLTIKEASVYFGIGIKQLRLSLIHIFRQYY